MSSRCYSDATMTNVQRYPLRLPDSLRAAIDQRAEMRFRSVNNEIIVLLKLGLANKAEEPNAITTADKLIARTNRAKRVKRNS
jgi:hypothetical protein